MSDPRERIETENLEATVLFLEGQTVDKTAYWWLGLRDPHEGAALWPEVVAFARAILAADEAWKDGQPEAIAYVFGHGETLIGYWFAEGHVLLKLQRAREPQTPGTVVTGKDVEIDRDIPPVWLMFEDAEAVRRMRGFFDTMARDLDTSLAKEVEP